MSTPTPLSDRIRRLVGDNMKTGELMGLADAVAALERENEACRAQALADRAFQTENTRLAAELATLRSRCEALEAMVQISVGAILDNLLRVCPDCSHAQSPCSGHYALLYPAARSAAKEEK